MHCTHLLTYTEFRYVKYKIEKNVSDVAAGIQPKLYLLSIRHLLHISETTEDRN